VPTLRPFALHKLSLDERLAAVHAEILALAEDAAALEYSKSPGIPRESIYMTMFGRFNCPCKMYKFGGLMPKPEPKKEDEA
jgi:hypothetical protein